MEDLQRNAFEIMREEEDKSFAGELFDWVMILLITVSLVFLVLDTYSMPAWYPPVTYWVELITSIIFSIEYILRFWISPLYYPELSPRKARLKYVFSFMAVVDFLAVMPFYLPMLLPVDLRVLRFFRLIRLLRLIKVSRYTESISIFVSVFKKKASQLITSLFVIFLLIIIASILMYDVEHEAQPLVFENAFSGLWWAMEAVTTAGNGEIYPITTMGRALAGMVSLLGIGVVAVPTGIISAGFVHAMQDNNMDAAGGYTPADAIAKYKALLDDGAITRWEYEEKKQGLLKKDEFLEG